MRLNFPKLYEGGLILMVSIWIILPNLIGLLGMLFLCIVIFGALRKELVFDRNSWLVVIFLFLPFYACFATNAIDPNSAIFSLEKKLSFLLFPLVFSFVPTFSLNKRRIENGFLFALFLMLVLCYLGAFFNYEEHNYDTAYLFSSQFSGLFHHPTYVSVFCALGIYLLFQRWQYPRSMREHLWSALGILWLCYTHYHLDSLSGLLFAILLLAFLLGKWVWQRKGKVFFLAFFTVGFLGLSIGISLIPSLRSNLFDSLNFTINYCKDPYGYTHLPRGEIRGNDARLILWTASAEILSQHPNGVGVGNLPSVMEAKLLEYGQINLAQKHYNSHNQFLHTAIETGWLGLVWLVFMVAGLVFWGIRNTSGILVVVTTGFAFNGLFESMLERQSGIVFWLLWSCLCLGLQRSFKSANHES
jgi:hypothetical protein